MRKCTLEIRTEDSEYLNQFLHRGTAKSRVLTRARILLKTAEGWSMEQIAQALDVSEATIANVRQRYRDGGLERVLNDKQQVKRRRALTGEGEAILVAIACSPVPDGHDHWTLRMLRERLIALEVVEQIDHTTIGHLLKKTTSNPGSGNSGAWRS